MAEDGDRHGSAERRALHRAADLVDAGKREGLPRELLELAELCPNITRLNRTLRGAAARIEALERDLRRARSTIQVAANALDQAVNLQRTASTACEDARCELKGFALEDLRLNTVPVGGDSAKATENGAFDEQGPESVTLDLDPETLARALVEREPGILLRAEDEPAHDARRIDPRCESCMEVPLSDGCGCTRAEATAGEHVHVRVPDGIVVEALQAVFPGFVRTDEVAHPFAEHPFHGVPERLLGQEPAHDAPRPGSTPDAAPEVEFMRELASAEGELSEETLRHAKEEVAGALEGWANDACQALNDWAGLDAGAVLPPGTVLGLKADVRRAALLKAAELLDAAELAVDLERPNRRS
jgi:hypothetical protein